MLIEKTLNKFGAFYVDYKYRIIFEFHAEGVVWFHSVGGHDIYGLY